jgi:hypothetical protein
VRANPLGSNAIQQGLGRVVGLGAARWYARDKSKNSDEKARGLSQITPRFVWRFILATIVI